MIRLPRAVSLLIEIGSPAAAFFAGVAGCAAFGCPGLPGALAFPLGAIGVGLGALAAGLVAYRRHLAGRRASEQLEAAVEMLAETAGCGLLRLDGSGMPTRVLGRVPWSEPTAATARGLAVADIPPEILAAARELRPRLLSAGRLLPHRLCQEPRGNRLPAWRLGAVLLDSRCQESLWVVANDASAAGGCPARRSHSPEACSDCKHKTQFLANLSHELRTPLNAIVGFADLMAAGRVEPGSPRHRTFVRHLLDAAHHLQSLIDSMLDFSRLELGRLDLYLERVDLAALVIDACGSFEPECKAQAVHIRTDVPPDPVFGVTDPVRVRQILFNFISNAIKVSPANGESRVTLSFEGEGAFRMAVRDQGPGISFEDQGKLFQAFSQLDAGPARKREGLGLGLAICRSLAQALGGEVGVQSSPGSGATFWAKLPVRPASSPERERARELVVAEARP